MQTMKGPTIGQCVLMFRAALDTVPIGQTPPRFGAYAAAWRRRVNRECGDGDGGGAIHRTASECLIALTGRIAGMLAP